MSFLKTFAGTLSTALLVWACAPQALLAMALMVEPSATACSVEAPVFGSTPPKAAARRLAGSTLAHGSRNIAWAWLTSPTARYPHASMGSVVHAGSVHVITSGGQEAGLTLPQRLVYEDLTPRLLDLDGDGLDELLLIEADSEKGAALVVLGLRPGANGKPELRELARSQYAGRPWRWLNPAGVADFDGDGKPDVAAVLTPHIGGVLTLYRYAPPLLVPFARAMDVSNHRMGEPELALSVVAQPPGLPPTLILPDQSLRALHALRWLPETQKWQELAEVKPLPHRIARLTPTRNAQGQTTGACATLADGSSWRVEVGH